MQPVGEVAQVHIMASPVGLNLDNSAGADGFAAKVFFNDGRNAKSVPVRKGTLEVLMFDGPIPAGTQGIQPLKTWRFTSEELISHEFKSHIGVGYDFVLTWGQDKPTRRNISVAGRYISPSGDSVFSTPTSITVMEKY